MRRDDGRLVERVVGDFPGDVERLEDGRGRLLLDDAVARAGDLDRHPDEVAGLHQLVVDEILRPALADARQIDADIGVEVHLRVGGVEVDDRDARGARLVDDLHEAAGVGARGDDRVRLGGDGGADRLLLRGDVAVVERGLDRLAGVLRPHVRPGEEIGPDRVGGRPVRNPVEGLGLRRQRQHEREEREAQTNA